MKIKECITRKIESRIDFKLFQTFCIIFLIILQYFCKSA